MKERISHNVFFLSFFLFSSSRCISKVLPNLYPSAQHSHHPGTLRFTAQFHRAANTLCPFTPAGSSLRSQVLKFPKSNVLHTHIWAGLDVVFCLVFLLLLFCLEWSTKRISAW